MPPTIATRITAVSANSRIARVLVPKTRVIVRSRLGGGFLAPRTLSTTIVIGHGSAMSAAASPMTASSAITSGFQWGRRRRPRRSPVCAVFNLDDLVVLVGKFGGGRSDPPRHHLDHAEARPRPSTVALARKASAPNFLAAADWALMARTGARHRSPDQPGR